MGSACVQKRGGDPGDGQVYEEMPQCLQVAYLFRVGRVAGSRMLDLFFGAKLLLRV